MDPIDAELWGILRQRIDTQKRGIGISVCLLDEYGSHSMEWGTTELNGSNRIDGRTMFEIGSISKVFTSLLLAIAVEKGEVKLDDPVAKYLPPEVTIPSRNGRQITLLDLATHHSGLPRMPDNFTPKDPENPYADYTPEQMYTFLSGYTLHRDIGTEYEYSNLGAGLLGHVLALRAGKSYDELLRERICRPLKMRSTGVVLSQEVAARLARPHKEDLSATKNWDLGVFAGAGGIRSNAEDMMKFLASEMGRRESQLQTGTLIRQVFGWDHAYAGCG